MSEAEDANSAAQQAASARLLLATTGGAPHSDPRLSAEHGLFVGAILDRRYRLVSRIGRGGFGDVWRAVELLPDGSELREVALKLLGQSFDDSGWAEEAKLLASLTHPALVTIYSAGILSDLGLPFVAMELLIGESLAELLRRRTRVPWRVALRALREAAAALDFIHDSGVVHLDLKPANLFLTVRQEVKVLDFGIALGRRGRAKVRPRLGRPSDPALAATAVLPEVAGAYAQTVSIEEAARKQGESPRLIVGTPGFIAPEVLRMCEPSAAADAYALGATLSQLISGTLPHAVSFEPSEDSDAATFRRYMEEIQEATLSGKMRLLERDVAPPGVAQLVARLCAVEPQERAGEDGLRALFDEVWERPYGAPRRPYPGPHAYASTDEGLLFGRDADVARLMLHLQTEGAVLIVGPPGAGKTSLVNAALVPALSRNPPDGCLELLAAFVRLGPKSPDLLLAEAVDQLHPDPSDDSAPPSDSLPPWQRLARAGKGGALRVLVIDGCERLLQAEPDQRAATLSLMEELLAAPKSVGLRVVLIAEQQSVEELAALRPGLATLGSIMRFLAQPPLAAAADLALAPARHAGLVVENPKALTELVEAELRANPVPLPAIAICLAAAARGADKTGKLLPLGPKDRTPTLGAYASYFAQNLPKEERSDCLNVLLYLGTSDGMLRPRELGELARLSELEPPAFETALRRLVRAFVVRQVGGNAEVSHPAFLAFDELERLRLAQATLLGLQERLAESAGAWEASHLKPEYLDPGPLLDAISQAGDRALLSASVGELEYLAASRRRRRRSRVVRALTVLLLLGSVAGVWVGQRALEARRAKAEQESRAASLRASLAELIGRARGADDPYARLAFLGQALRLGADEPALSVELLATAEDLAPVRFLTPAGVERPDMPFSDRWVVGLSGGGKLLVGDLEPVARVGEAEVIEDVDVNENETLLRALMRTPVVKEVDFGSPVLDFSPFAFDTSLAVRTSAGEVYVVRLRENGEVAVAAKAAMVCRGAVEVAARAPVLACVSDDGVNVFDLRTGKSESLVASAAVLALAPDGSELAMGVGNALWVQPLFGAREPQRLELGEPPALLAYSPRDPAVAVVSNPKPKGGHDWRLRVVASNAGLATLIEAPVPQGVSAMRWDPAGLDVALCKLSGQATWIHLRSGGLADDHPIPRGGCRDRMPGAPRLVSRFALGELSSRASGEHFSRAFLLSEGRAISTSLALNVSSDRRLTRRARFALSDPKGRPLPVADRDGFSELVWNDGQAIVELSHSRGDIERNQPPEIVVAGARDGIVKQRVRGHLLGACPNGRVLAWRRSAETFELFDVKSGAVLSEVAREPGYVVGLGPRCEKWLTQGLDGTLLSHAVDGQAPPLQALAQSAGYVFDREPSRGFEGGGEGLLLALSSGEIVRFDEAAGALRLLARAEPRAFAISDGPLPGEALFVDGSGLWRIMRDGAVKLLAPLPPRGAWEDLAVVADGRAIVLVSVDGVSVYDLEAGAIVASAGIRGMTKLAAWDAGQLAAYAPDLEGLAHAVLMPFEPKAALSLADLSSNLRVDDEGRLVLRK